MSKINIQVSRETHRELSEIGRKGQSFDDIVHECIIAKQNELLNNYWYFPYRTTNNLNLQYGKISTPKNDNGKIEVHIEDIINAVRSSFDNENLIIKGYDKE